MKRGKAGRRRKMTTRRVFLGTVVMVGVSLLFVGALAGCGGGSKGGTGNDSAPAGGQTAPGGTAKPQLLLFTAPG
jgi:hypothetical protein